MKIKVCGMKHPDNIKEISALPIDFMGMIFFDKSPRYVQNLILSDLDILPKTVKKVGVFVNADINFVKEKIRQYNLDLVQLHGTESPHYCAELNKTIPVIKAFSVAKSSDIKIVDDYTDSCTYFLFDTKTPQYGGSGQKFDWTILNDYVGTKPFLLSGGISADDIDTIKAINHPMLLGVDLNSKFEIEPGLKDINLLDQFIGALTYK